MALVAAAVVLAPVVASASDALANPPANIAPQPNFDASGPCTAGANGTYACANPCVSAQLTFASTYDNAPACAANPWALSRPAIEARAARTGRPDSSEDDDAPSPRP